MALEPLENQAIIFPTDEDCIECDTDCFCQRYSANDRLFWQAKQSPCGAVQNCNSEFEAGPELVADGNFVTDPSAAGWTLETGASGKWKWDTVDFLLHKLNGASRSAYINIPSMVYMGKYQLTFEITEVAIAGVLTPYVGGQMGTPVTAVGIYTQYITAGATAGDLKFTSDVFIDCKLDNVSLVEIPCWATSPFNIEPNLPAYSGWDVRPGSACHVKGFTYDIYPVGGTSINAYYQVVVTINNSTGGTLTFSLANGVPIVFSGNGTFIEYMYSGNGSDYTKFVPSADFDGCLTFYTQRLMTTDFIAELVDPGDGAPLQDISSSISYYRDWVTITSLWSALGVSHRCFKLKITDTCTNAEYLSNCLCWDSDQGCYRIVNGYSDSPAFGFEFINTGFRLQQRLIFTLNSPEYPEDVDSYLFSNSVRDSSFASVEKYSTIFFESVPEYVHDCISLQRRLRHFALGNGSGVLTEYFTKPGTYQPEWVKNTNIRQAPSRFDIRKKQGNIFMSNCE